MSFTVKKERGILYFNDLGGIETRNQSTIWCIKEADKKYNWPDFSEKKIYTGDANTGNNNDITYSKNNLDNITKNIFDNLAPDFNFHSWPQARINDYNETIRLIDENGRLPYEVNKVGWIGNINTNWRRGSLINIGKQHSDKMEIMDMNWSASNNIALNANRYMSLPDLVKKYSILLDIEGCGYSGRLKYLFWSHRPVILIDRPDKEYFYDYLKPWREYIPVKNDLSDLVEKVDWIFNNKEKAQQIANNAYEFSKRILTREAAYKQWNNLMTNVHPHHYYLAFYNHLSEFV
jgi:hypothetical protein